MLIIVSVQIDIVGADDVVIAARVVSFQIVRAYVEVKDTLRVPVAAEGILKHVIFGRVILESG